MKKLGTTRQFSRSTSATPTANEFSHFVPPARPQSAKSGWREENDEGDRCECCPYGYHIDLDFVQYAAEEAKSSVSPLHGSLKSFKSKSRKWKTAQPRDREEVGGDQMNPKFVSKVVYESQPKATDGEGRSNGGGEGGGGKNSGKNTAESGTKSGNQCIFTDSLENVMSDFEETLSRGGANKNKAYNSSGYETTKGQHRGGSTAMGYTSDCGYAVPAATPNRPTTLHLLGKTAAEENHYYASPSNLTKSTAPTRVEYAIADATIRLPRVTQTRSSLANRTGSSASPQPVNGTATNPIAVSADTNSASSLRAESKTANNSGPSFETSFNQSEPASASFDLTSPRLVASSPLPPKPSLGLSGRVGTHIEQLASRLDPASPVLPRRTGRSSVDSFYRGTSPDYSPTRRILELENRLKSSASPAQRGEDRRLQEELNWLIHDGKMAGHRRAITPTIVESPGNGYATALARAMSSVAAAEREKQRQNLPEPPPRRESVTRMQSGTPLPPSVPPTPPMERRTRTYSVSGAPGTGNGSLNLDAFYSYRRTTPTTALSTGGGQPAPGRHSSLGRGEDRDYVSDSEYALGDRSLDRFGALRRSRHLLSRPTTTIPPTEPKTIRDNDRQLVQAWQKELKESPVEVNGIVKKMSDGSAQTNPTPLMRSVGMLTDPTQTTLRKHASTCTPPLPQPKPCLECDSLRQRLLALSVKPLMFTRGTGTDECTCSTCHHRSRLTYGTVETCTVREDTVGFRRDAATNTNMIPPCEDCQRRNDIKKVTLGVNTPSNGIFGSTISMGTNTEAVEVRNRHANTDQKNFQSSHTNTEQVGTANSASMVEKSILLNCGAYRSITSNTTPAQMVTFGVNTDPTSNGPDAPAGVAPEVSVGLPKLVETREQGTWTDNDNLEEVRSVEKKSIGVGTNLQINRPRMVDRYVDSTVRTRDVGTRTPPPPPPPLQPLRSSGSQTVNEERTVVSVGSGECTVQLRECDVCAGNEHATKSDVKSTSNDAETQTKLRTMTRIPSLERKVKRSSGDGSEQMESPISLDGSMEEAKVRSEDQGAAEQKPKRGIHRIFSPTQESDVVMWTSQTSAASDASDRAAERTEDSTVVCPLDDEEEKVEEEKGEHKESSKKFDYTKPRPTRAFALSKAAAAKKLLTSDTSPSQQQQQQRRAAGSSGKQSSQQPQSTFQRNYIQSRSVRVDTRKGDPLAYITEKKLFQQGQTAASGAGSKTTKPATEVQPNTSAGLKGKVVIKKPPIRKTTPSSNCPRVAASPNRFRPPPFPHQRRLGSVPGTATVSSSLSSSSSLKDEEGNIAEAEDVVGPLPSELAAMESMQAACYTNVAADNEEDGAEFRPMKNVTKRLVGEVVENLPVSVEQNGDESMDRSGGGSLGESSSSDEEADEETDESFEEGSYDTNGNISSTCDVAAATASTISDDTVDGDKLPSPKFEMSAQLREACGILLAWLVAGKNTPPGEKVDWAQKYVQHEWLKAAASKRADPAHVGDYLDALEDFSPQLLQHVVNFCDQNENTALHYAVSRGHFDIVSLLLDTKMCNLNKANKAGYTPVMLASLCPITSETDSMVVQRLFQMGDVNIKACQHGQTALMLAVSHGNLETTKLLLEAGAGVNIQDEEGSTALMCAAEHGHKEIVRSLLAHPEIDASLTDSDNSTALSIAVENDHKDIGILIYAHLNYGRPPPSLQAKSAPVWC